MQMKTSDIPVPLLLGLAALSWVLLLWPNPRTVFLAGCAACITFPLYRKLTMRGRALELRVRREMREAGNKGAFKRGWLRFKLSLVIPAPMAGYVAILFASVAVPISLLSFIIIPQAGAGMAHLQELCDNNFELPHHWIAYIDGIFDRLPSSAFIAKLVDEARNFLRGISNEISALSTSNIAAIGSKVINLLGGTMSVLWGLVLFVTLTIIFARFGASLSLLAPRLLCVHPSMFTRFVVAIRKALKAVLLGIVLVAAIQGVLCALGFYFASIPQFAFWGLLAFIVAPIPTVGTALVWGPLCLHQWFSGNTMPAVFLALWGAVAVSGADTLLRPLFLKQGIQASFLVLILAMICGIASFGTIGLVAGPVLLAFSIQAVKEAKALSKKSRP